MKEGKGDRDDYVVGNITRWSVLKSSEIFGDTSPRPHQCGCLYETQSSVESL